MCIDVRNTTPMVAPQDIPVLKYVEKVEGTRGKFKTPFQNTPVEFGKELIAQPETIELHNSDVDYFGHSFYSIKSGVIHARVTSDDPLSHYCQKAIIPKGTEFWVNPSGRDIAAKAIIITDESVDLNSWSMPEILAQTILKTAPENKGIHIGDYQLIDNNFVSPSKAISENEVRGQVCGFYKNGSPIICGLERLQSTWDCDCRKLDKQYSTYESAWPTFNGQKVMAKYKKQYAAGRGFEAFHLCSIYRKGYGEEWFLGALGEVATMLNNALYLNAARTITKLGYQITEYQWYWSCTEYGNNSSFVCSSGNDKVHRGRSLKDSEYGSVVPFFASQL